MYFNFKENIRECVCMCVNLNNILVALSKFYDVYLALMSHATYSSEHLILSQHKYIAPAELKLLQSNDKTINFAITISLLFFIITKKSHNSKQLAYFYHVPPLYATLL